MTVAIGAFAIKADIRDPRATSFAFAAQKSMYGGKTIAAGDTVFVFASETRGGHGLAAMGVVTAADAAPRVPAPARQTPRVSLAIQTTALAERPLGRREVVRFTDWHDGRPESEINFKLYRQATNKVVGLSEAAATFLRGFFGSECR